MPGRRVSIKSRLPARGRTRELSPTMTGDESMSEVDGSRRAALRAVGGLVAATSGLLMGCGGGGETGCSKKEKRRTEKTMHWR